MAPVIRDIAALRIAVFRDFPYLYDGDLAYEERYLSEFGASSRSVVMIARAAGRVIGASTGAPLDDVEDAWAAPFRERGFSTADRFYCAESVLLEEWRGLGLGHAFFDAREEHARALGMESSCFCSVIRPDDHADRPSGHRSNDGFWRKRGYAPLDNVVARFAWRDIGQAQQSEKALQFWGRTL